MNNINEIIADLKVVYADESSANLTQNQIKRTIYFEGLYELVNEPESTLSLNKVCLRLKSEIGVTSYKDFVGHLAEQLTRLKVAHYLQHPDEDLNLEIPGEIKQALFELRCILFGEIINSPPGPPPEHTFKQPFSAPYSPSHYTGRMVIFFLNCELTQDLVTIVDQKLAQSTARE